MLLQLLRGDLVLTVREIRESFQNTSLRRIASDDGLFVFLAQLFKLRAFFVYLSLGAFLYIGILLSGTKPPLHEAFREV